MFSTTSLYCKKNEDLLDDRDMDTAGATSSQRREELVGQDCQGKQQGKGKRWGQCQGQGKGQQDKAQALYDYQQESKSQGEKAGKGETEGQAANGSGEKQQKVQNNWKCHR